MVAQAQYSETTAHLSDTQRRIVFELINRPGSRRNDLADLLGMSPQTMMRAVKPLVARGILSEEDDSSKTPGKPARLISVQTGALLTLGVVMSEGHTAVELSDISGNRIDRIQVTESFSSARAQMDGALRLINEMREDQKDKGEIVSLGVVVQGYFRARGRSVVARADPAGWATIDILAEMSERANLPTTIVNDGKAFAASLMGETESQDFLVIILGSGVGGGAVSGGQLLSGKNGNAGEFGRFFLRDERRPTERNLLRALGWNDWTDWSGIEHLSPPQADAMNGWIDNAAKQLGDALTLCLGMLDFDTIFIGSRMPDEILSLLSDRVQVSPLGDDLGLNADSYTNPLPVIQPRRIQSFSGLATKIAAQTFLIPNRVGTSTNPANGTSRVATTKRAYDSCPN